MAIFAVIYFQTFVGDPLLEQKAMNFLLTYKFKQMFQLKLFTISIPDQKTSKKKQHVNIFMTKEVYSGPGRRPTGKTQTL